MLVIRFKCVCMQDEASVAVRYRRPGEDIVDWMREVVQVSLSDRHRALSPDCRAATMEQVKIPAPDNAPFVGGKPELDS